MKVFLLIGVFFFLFIGSSPAAVLSSEGGRFIFGQVSEHRADQYMLDTQTGMLWRMFKDKNGVEFLGPIYYRYNDDLLHFKPSTYFNPQEGDVVHRRENTPKKEVTP